MLQKSSPEKAIKTTLRKAWGRIRITNKKSLADGQQGFFKSGWRDSNKQPPSPHDSMNYDVTTGFIQSRKNGFSYFDSIP